MIYRLALGEKSEEQEVVDMLNQIPDEANAEELIGRLYLKAKLNQAEAAVESGDMLSHEEVVERSQQWFNEQKRD